MRVTRILLLSMLLATPAYAGAIFGTLRINGASVGNQATVYLTCGRDDPYKVATDDYGAYNVNVPSGRCSLYVNYRNTNSEPYPVASSEDPARYDFDLVYQDGRLVLKRR
jgi:hypothetical protein